MTYGALETPAFGLGKFIRENRFFVPNHQRDYSWTVEYVEQFLKDLYEAHSKGTPVYFCGLMVFTQDKAANKLKVLDGQQRLATTLMLFSAIRNWLASYGETSDQTKIENYIKDNNEFGASESPPRLTLNPAKEPLRLLIEEASKTDAPFTYAA